MDNSIFFSPAKINLRLEILKKRTDDYHEIRTIFQKISLYDEIKIRVTSEKKVKVSVNDPAIPSDHNNLAHRAASLLIEDQKLNTGVSIHIVKKIPAGAGLGGGSSNAASTLIGLNKLMNLNLKYDYLRKLSVTIGADVPFFLSDSGTAIGTGIGEKLKHMALKTKLWFLIIYPDFSISTNWAYKTYSKYNLLTKRKKKINLSNSIANLDSAVSLLLNDFEDVVIPEYPEIKKLKEDLLKTGASGSLLSGSGSSVFGIFPTKEDAEKALAMLPCQSGHKTFTVHSI